MHVICTLCDCQQANLVCHAFYRKVPVLPICSSALPSGSLTQHLTLYTCPVPICTQSLHTLKQGFIDLAGLRNMHVVSPHLDLPVPACPATLPCKAGQPLLAAPPRPQPESAFWISGPGHSIAKWWSAPAWQQLVK